MKMNEDLKDTLRTILMVAGFFISIYVFTIWLKMFREGFCAR